jgi:hypothetical protein
VVVVAAVGRVVVAVGAAVVVVDPAECESAGPRGTVEVEVEVGDAEPVSVRPSADEATTAPATNKGKRHKAARNAVLFAPALPSLRTAPVSTGTFPALSYCAWVVPRSSVGCSKIVHSASGSGAKDNWTKNGSGGRSGGEMAERASPAPGTGIGLQGRLQAYRGPHERPLGSPRWIRQSG